MSGMPRIPSRPQDPGKWGSTQVSVCAGLVVSPPQTQVRRAVVSPSRVKDEKGEKEEVAGSEPPCAVMWLCTARPSGRLHRLPWGLSMHFFSSLTRFAN